MRKHVAKAEAITHEVLLGYPDHGDHVIGQLSEAEDEAVRDFPALALMIRSARLRYELYYDELQDGRPPAEIASLCPDLEEVLTEVRVLLREARKEAITTTTDNAVTT